MVLVLDTDILCVHTSILFSNFGGIFLLKLRKIRTSVGMNLAELLLLDLSELVLLNVEIVLLKAWGKCHGK